MNTVEDMMTFLDAWNLANRGEDPSKAIENAEKRGQAEVVRNQRLPKKVNENQVASEILFRGITSDMDYNTRRQIADVNLYEYTQKQYEKMGIKIVGEHNDLFYNVELPEGWQVKATEHHMWNDVVDEKGRIRMKFFYKAASYDRSAFTNFQTRYRLDVDHTADPCSEYGEWKRSPYQGRVKDGENIIYKTACIQAVESYPEEQEIKGKLWDEIEDFMLKNFPDYKNIHAYWD